MYRKWFPRLFSLLLLIGLLCGCTKQDFTYIDAKQGVARVYCTMRGADGALIADSNGSVATLSPRNSATRAQVAAVLMRYLEQLG